MLCSTEVVHYTVFKKKLLDFLYTRTGMTFSLSIWPMLTFQIHITCGPDHQLTNAYEPSRCEYAFDFITPCACDQHSQPQVKEIRDEL